MWGQADRDFVDILSAVRGGQCSAAVLDKLKDRCRRPLVLLDGILPTKVSFYSAPLHSILVCLYPAFTKLTLLPMAGCEEGH